MKTAFTWSIILTLLIGCIGIQWLPNAPVQQQQAHITIDKVIVLKSLAWPVMVVIVCGTPSWILLSTWRVKKAIEKAQEPDYDGIRHWLRSTAAPLYPSPRYSDIVRLLRQLYTTPSAKPEIKASCFSQYFTTRGQGYFLTLEGKLKMLDRINSGFLSAKFMYDYGPKEIGRIVRNVIVVAVMVKFGASIIGAIVGWFYGH